jgi:hypothetical protein
MICNASFFKADITEKAKKKLVNEDVNRKVDFTINSCSKMVASLSFSKSQSPRWKPKSLPKKVVA